MAEISAGSMLLVVLLVSINIWGATNGLILLNYLRDARRQSHVARGIFEATLFMSMNVTCWMLIILESIFLPQKMNDEGRGAATYIIGLALFFGASLSISYALHRLRSLVMSPKTYDPAGTQ